MSHEYSENYNQILFHKLADVKVLTLHRKKKETIIYILPSCTDFAYFVTGYVIIITSAMQS